MLNDSFNCHPEGVETTEGSLLYIMKKILLAVLFFTLFAPVYVSAANSTLAPDFNPVCWNLDQCNNSRAFFLGKTPQELKGNKDGWLENEDPCNKPGWGKCLPGGITKTTIAFGGKKTFTDIGEFLKYNYNFGLSIAGILAVIMIVVAGIQWATSGGNSEAISSSKKRIGGALIGLLIAYLSYTILSIVNPALVNLRLPQVYMIRPINVVPQFCKDVESPTSTQFAVAAEKGAVVDKTKFPDAKLQSMELSAMSCGKQYFVGGAAGATCMGATCDKKQQSCLPVTITSDNITLTPGQVLKTTPGCMNAQLVFHFTIENSLENFIIEKTPLVAKIGGKDWLDKDGFLDFENPFLLWPVCSGANGNYIGKLGSEQWDANDTEITSYQRIEKSLFYEYYLSFNNVATTLPTAAHPDAYWKCENSDKVAGFVFKFELDSNWSMTDPNFYVSKSHVGSWKSISTNGFITNADLEKGVYVEALISAQVLQELEENTGTQPFVGTQNPDGVSWKKAAGI